ncbi:hypothetical protein EDC44_1571, partial [Cricetibacter osteomyelitidis]
MSEKNKESPQAEKPRIPAVAFPLKPKAENSKNVLQQYFTHLAHDPSARFLFNEIGLWHQGIHLRADKFKASEFDNEKICAIADGKLIAYKVDSEYKNDNPKEPANGTIYSTGFFLLEHEIEYPKGNKLTFYSLYRHTAKLGEYKSSFVIISGKTQSADKKNVMIRDNNKKLVAQLPDGWDITVRKDKAGKNKLDELLWYKDDKGVEHKPDEGRWTIFHRSYTIESEQVEPVQGIPLLIANKIDTEVDSEVKLTKAIEIKAGTELGLMGEYNQPTESGKRLLHLEVFTYDDINVFRKEAKKAYDKDKEKKGIQDNFLYVNQGSRIYSYAGDSKKIIDLHDQTKVEIMLPLSEVEKLTVSENLKDKNAKQRTYYNIQPYLHGTTSGVGIYVD